MMIEGTTISSPTYETFGAEELFVDAGASIAQRDIEFHRSPGIAHFCDDPSVSIYSTGGLVLLDPHGSKIAEERDQFQSLGSGAWRPIYFPMRLAADWDAATTDINSSVALSLLKRVRVFFNTPEINPGIPQSPGPSAMPTRDTLASRLVAADEARRNRLATELGSAFDEDPLEDGWSHPAESIISHALAHPRATDWLSDLCIGASPSRDAASILLCLSRLDRPGELVWRVKLVREALTRDGIQLRDAAVQAAESWGDRELGYVLRRHEESIPWLRDYVAGVIEYKNW